MQLHSQLILLARRFAILSLLVACFPLPAFANRTWCERLAIGASDAITSTDRTPTTRENLQTNIALLRQEVGPTHETAGYWGPNSVLWKVAANPFLPLLGQKTLYLQLAQPAAAQGVAEHSARLASHFVERFQSTFNNLWRMIYGTSHEAERIANALFGVHARITGVMPVDAGAYRAGERYSANDPEAALWVAETFVLAMKESYELGAGRLSRRELDQLALEARRFAMLFGVPAERAPRTWSEMEQYFREVTRDGGELVFTPDARRIESHYRKRTFHMGFTGRVMRLGLRFSDALTAELLPKHLARELGIESGLATKFMLASTQSTLRALYSRLPEWARIHPVARIAHARVEGRTPNPRDTIAYQVMLGRLPADLRALLAFAWPDVFPVEALPLKKTTPESRNDRNMAPDWSGKPKPRR